MTPGQRVYQAWVTCQMMEHPGRVYPPWSELSTTHQEQDKYIAASLEWQADVQAFHMKFGVPVAVPWTAPLMELRRRLHAEEYSEMDRALVTGDLVEMVDGIADLIYVLLGTCVSLGIDLRPIWDAVHASNMAKEGGGTRADGKILKPPGWVPPDIKGLLAKQGLTVDSPKA